MSEPTTLTSPAPLRSTVASLQAGKIALRDYVENICDRIEQVDPYILALLPEPGRRSRLLAEAAALERRHPVGGQRPSLYGALVGVKDIFRVDGFETRAGSALPPGLFDGPEAISVARLREAGALVLGKTVTTEFAFREPGPTRNPHNRAHTPGGSSSGSAASVAAGFASLALGTQTVGSVIRPAAFCGAVGFKPSLGRIAAEGIIFFSRTADQVGLFTQDAAGMTLAAAALLKGWQPEAVAGMKGRMPVLGVPEGPYLEQADPTGRSAFESHLSQLEEAGCEVRRVPALADIEVIAKRHMDLVAAEFAEVQDVWFRQYGAFYRPRTAELIEQGRTVSAEELELARGSTSALLVRLHELMDREGLDAWASPPAPGSPPKGLAFTGSASMNLPWTHAGMPAMTLPAGRAAHGLPLGLQLTARFGADERLLAWTEALEPVLVT